MSKLNIGKVETPVLFAAPPKGSVELALFSTADGSKIVSNADRSPFSPIDGSPTQLMSSKKTILTARQIDNCVTLGRCSGCMAKLVASASMADCIEAAGESIHCPVCTATLAPQIDLNVLTSALRDEYAATADLDDDDDSADDADAGDEDDDAGDDEDFGDDSDADSDDGDEDEDFGDDDFDDEGDDDADDDSDEEGEGDDDEIATAAAQLRKRIKRRKLLAGADMDDSDDDADADDDMDADSDDDVDAAAASLRKRVNKKRRKALASDMDDGEEDDAGVPDGDGDEDDDVAAEASVRKRMRGKFAKKRRAATASDDVTDDDSADDADADADGDGDGDGFTDEENEVVASLASLVRHEYAKRGLELSSDRTVAGRGRRTDAVDEVLASARDRLRSRGGVDGNKRVKSQVALAADGDDTGLDAVDLNETTEGDDPQTPGTNEDLVVSDGDTPGTEQAGAKKRKVVASDDDADDAEGEGEEVDNTDDGDEEVAGDSTVDWRRSTPELVASTASTDVHVFVAGRPVGRLVKEQASAGVAAQWGRPTLAAGFAQAAAAGLMPETAKEFGFVANRFVVKGDEVFRQTLRRSADINSVNLQREVASGNSRYRQSVQTAFIAAVKGSYSDLTNPVRDSLVASLHKCGVHDARTVVDKAFASSGDALVAGIFAKADELASKSDAARNEAASFVAQAAYQSREVEPAADLASRLAAGNRVAVPAVASAPVQEVASAPASTTQERVRAALRSIR